MKLRNVSELYRVKIELSQIPSKINNMDHGDFAAYQFFTKFSQNSSCDDSISYPATYFDARCRKPGKDLNKRL